MEEGMPDAGYNPTSEELFEQNQQLKSRNTELAGALGNVSFNEQEEQNLIHYQLETDKILERIEHFLKGDQIKFGEKGAHYIEPIKKVLTSVKKDNKTNIKYYVQEFKELKKGSEVLQEVVVRISNKEGEEIDVQDEDSKKMLSRMKGLDLVNLGYKYIEVTDENKKPFNDYGVAELMRIMSMYITKETFLSYYSEERINEILGDLGDTLNNFLYCNYEKMGMDTKFKESKYTLICINLLHAVESCYRRALQGQEQENIRTRAIVTQSNSFGGSQPSRMAPVRKKWNPLKPSTW